MKTLIKTNNSLILVSDEEIKEGDLIIFLKTLWIGFARTIRNNRLFGSKSLSINESNIDVDKSDCKKVLSQSPKISKEVADEIGWIDVGELAKETTNKYVNEREKQTAYLEFIQGFQKAQELNQKKYTEENIMTWYKYVKTHTCQEAFEHLHKSLSQPQQWQVEAVEIDGVWSVTKIIK